MEEKKGEKRERVSCFAWKLRSKFEAEPDHPTIQLSSWANILVNMSHWRLWQMVGWSGSLETNLDILSGFFTCACSFPLCLLFPYSKMQFSLKRNHNKTQTWQLPHTSTLTQDIVSSLVIRTTSIILPEVKLRKWRLKIIFLKSKLHLLRGT